MLEFDNVNPYDDPALKRARIAQLELDFPQLSREALDDAEIQARLPKPPGQPRKILKLQPG